MGNPIDYWYQKYLALKAKMDEMTAGEEHLASVRKMSPNDLEDAVENYIAPIENDEGLDYINFNGRDIKDAFIAGAKWQKQHDAELIEIAYNDGITIGMTKQKEQMMKEAVEGEFMLTPYPIISLDDCKNYDFKDCDKVHIIIVKEKENGTE